MATLNDYNDKTKKNIHLMVTSLCDRNCRYCCNKQYDLNDIPYVTDSELREAENIFITGGEPFRYSNPNNIAFKLKSKYRNIKDVYVYTNAKELNRYLGMNSDWNCLIHLSGITVSIKNKEDFVSFLEIVNNKNVQQLKSNWLYVFDDLVPENLGNFQLSKREWEPDFKPDPNSIFRKV